MNNRFEIDEWLPKYLQHLESYYQLLKQADFALLLLSFLFVPLVTPAHIVPFHCSLCDTFTEPCKGTFAFVSRV